MRDTDDGGFRELDGYFEGTKLAFVDYLRPHALLTIKKEEKNIYYQEKGFKRRKSK